MRDLLWHAVSMVFSGRINISFTHASTITNSSSEIFFNSSLRHLSGPGDFSDHGFTQCSTYFVVS